MYGVNEGPITVIKGMTCSKSYLCAIKMFIVFSTPNSQ